MMERRRDSIVVDTNVVSYIHRGEPIAQPYMARMTGLHAVISFQTYAELLYGAFNSDWGQRRTNDLVEHINESYDVLGCNERLVIASARLRADYRRRGRQLDAADAWIAATAVLLNCPLLSHDRDFGSHPGLEVIRYG